MIIRLGFLITLMCFTSFPVFSEWSFAEESYAFGPEMSEAEACERAKQRAREKALLKIAGERLSSQDLLSCSDRQEDKACIMHRHTWSMVDGKIKSERNLKKSTVDLSDGIRRCVVKLEVDVVRGFGEPDPSFDIGVSLNQIIFQEGQEMSLRLEPTKNMYVSIFQWSHYENEHSQVSRIFPNQFDLNNHFGVGFTVPTKEGMRDYVLRLTFPNAQKVKDNFVDEFLMVIGTKDDVPFREQYSIDEFQSILLEMPRSEFRQVKKAYTIIRPN